MKYRIRKTGEIIDVVSYSGLTSTIRDKNDDWVDYIDSNGNEIRHAQLNKYWDLELVNETETDIDWEQRRYEIARDVLASSSIKTAVDLLGAGYSIGEDNMGVACAKQAVAMADALIVELKKR